MALQGTYQDNTDTLQVGDKQGLLLCWQRQKSETFWGSKTAKNLFLPRGQKQWGAVGDKTPNLKNRTRGPH